MNIFSLRTVIDDIMLIVRNNNISESEDLSRDQIRAWVMAYKAYLAKKKEDKDKETGEDIESDSSMSSEIGPLALVDVKSTDPCLYTKKTKEKIPDILGDSDSNIINVTDESGCSIQLMNASRRHYHNFRRYTYGEPSYMFQDGYIYIQGADIKPLQYIYVEANFAEGDGEDEDSIIIPSWMIPDIKKAIMDNELSFMLKRPSDDANNSTLASVKPHGPQDQEA